MPDRYDMFLIPKTTFGNTRPMHLFVLWCHSGPTAWPRKTRHFPACPRATTIRKIAPRPPKSTKHEPLYEEGSLRHISRQRLFLNPRTSKFRLDNRFKSALEASISKKSPSSFQRNRKYVRMGPEVRHKSIKI